MSKKSEVWRSIALAALASFIVSASVIWVVRSIAAYGGEATAGDYLSFVGSLLGAGLAVIGALYVESTKRRKEREDDLLLMLDGIQHLREALAGILKVPVEDLLQQQSDALELLERHEEAAELISFANDTARITSARVFLEMRRVTKMLEAHQAMVERETGIVSDHATEGVLDIYRKRMSAYAEHALPILDQALAEIRATS